MLREALLKAGLTEEQAATAERLFSASLDKEYVPMHRFKQVNDQRQNAVTELENYKKENGSAADLQKQVADLTKQLEDTKSQYQKADLDRKKRSAIAALIGGKVYDEELVIGLMDLEKITLDDKGVATGAEDLVKELQTAKPFLWKQEQVKGTAKPSQGNPAPQPDKSFAVQLAEKRLAQQAVGDQAKKYFN